MKSLLRGGLWLTDNLHEEELFQNLKDGLFSESESVDEKS
jgi:hypothetical protein